MTVQQLKDILYFLVVSKSSMVSAEQKEYWNKVQSYVRNEMKNTTYFSVSNPVRDYTGDPHDITFSHQD